MHLSFLGGMHNEKSIVKAEVEEDTEILFLPIDKVSLFIKEYPEWLDYIFRLYHKRFEELLDIINAIAFKKVDERLRNLLQKKSDYQIRVPLSSLTNNWQTNWEQPELLFPGY